MHAGSCSSGPRAEPWGAGGIRRPSVHAMCAAPRGAPRCSLRFAGLVWPRAGVGAGRVPRRQRAWRRRPRNGARTPAAPLTHALRQATAARLHVLRATRPHDSSGAHHAARWRPRYTHPGRRAARAWRSVPRCSSRACGAVWAGTRSPRCSGARPAACFRCRCLQAPPTTASSPGSAARRPRRPCSTGCGSSGGTARRPG